MPVEGGYFSGAVVGSPKSDFLWQPREVPTFDWHSQGLTVLKKVCRFQRSSCKLPSNKIHKNSFACRCEFEVVQPFVFPMGRGALGWALREPNTIPYIVRADLWRPISSDVASSRCHRLDLLRNSSRRLLVRRSSSCCIENEHLFHSGLFVLAGRIQTHNHCICIIYTYRAESHLCLY